MKLVLTILVIICIIAIISIAAKACKSKKLNHVEWISLIAAVLGGFGSLFPIFPSAEASEQIFEKTNGTLTTQNNGSNDWIYLVKPIEDCRIVCNYSIQKSEENAIFGVAIKFRQASQPGEQGIRAFVNANGTWGHGYWGIPFPTKAEDWKGSGMLQIKDKKGLMLLGGTNNFEVFCKGNIARVIHNKVFLGEFSLTPMMNPGIICFGVETQSSPVEVTVQLK